MTPADDERLDDLVDRWQELAAAGRAPDPAELCRDRPDLLAALQRQVAVLRRFGVPGRESADPGRDTVSHADPGGPSTAGPDAPAAGTPATGVPAAVGTYRVARLLGEGGMGRVLEAEDPALGRRVAVKQMHPHVAAQPGARERFLREARAAAGLRHGHVAPVYHVGEDGGSPYLVMPLLAGESLADRLDRGAPLPPAEAARVGREAAEGLAAAHARGLVHRDVKPANLWLEDPGARVQVLDFGLARAADGSDGLTRPGALVGTPGYMAPEQVDGGAVDARADLFALGATLYHAAAGRPAFAGPTLTAVLRAVAEHHPPAPRAVNPAVPAGLSDLIVHLLAKDPAARPASARAVADRLAAVERELAVTRSDVPVELGARPAKRPGRRRAVAALVVLAVLLTVGYLYGGAVVRYATNTGVVVIEADGPGVEVTIKDGSAVVHDRVKGRRFVLTPGEYELEVREEGPDGVRFGAQRFTLARGGRVVLTARLEPSKQTQVKPGAAPATPAADANRTASEWVLSLGGKATVRTAGKEAEVTASKNLPPGPFELVAVDLWGKAGVTDEGLRHLSGLNHLRLITLTYAQVGDTGLAHLRDLPALSHLTLHSTWVTDAGMAHLAGLKTLGYLNLDNTRVGDAGLAHLSGLSGLTELWLGRTRVTDAGLRHLAALPKLGRLYLWSTQVSGPGLDHVARMPALVSLNLNETRVTDADLARLKGRPLTSLHLDGRQFTEVGVGHLTGLGLKYLAIAGPRVGDAELARLRSLPTLTFVVLGYAGVSDDGIKHLRDLPNLTGVSLTASDVGDAGAEVLGTLNGLTHCILTGTRVTASGVENLRAARPGCTVTVDTTYTSANGRRPAEWVLSVGGRVRVGWTVADREVSAAGDLPGGEFSLKEVDLRGSTKVSDADLRRFPPLLRLGLSGTAVGDAGLAALKVGNLRRLDLSGTRVTDAGLAQLRDARVLGELSLAETAVTDAGLKHLRGLTGLVELDLTGTRVTEAGAAELRTALPGCDVRTGPSPDREAAAEVLARGGGVTIRAGGRERTIARGAAPPAEPFQLVEVTLWGHTSIGDDDLRSLRDLPQLRLINLPGTRVTDAGLAHLDDLPGLMALLLADTLVTDEGLGRLGRFPNLTNLHLARTRVGDDGLRHLAAVSRLTSVNLSYTRVTDAGLAHLRDRTGLTRLSLGDTAVTDGGLDHVRGLTGLGWLDLFDTRVTDAGLGQLRPLERLGTLSLDGSQFTEAGLDQVRGLPNLRYLFLVGRRVTDAEVARLKGLPRLVEVRLLFASVTDDGVRHLRDLPDLARLSLAGTRVTDASVEHLRDLKGLNRCDLTGTLVTDAGVRRLREALPGCEVVWPEPGPESRTEHRTARWVLEQGGKVRLQTWEADRVIDAPDQLPGVGLGLVAVDLSGKQDLTDRDLVSLQLNHYFRDLNLAGTSAGDDTLGRLKGVVKLTTLNLSGTRVTDAGLRHLHGLPCLRELDLRGARVSEDAAAALRRALPECHVLTDPPGK